METYTPGKDTGRYWDAGASNVHWVIVTDAQVEQGIRLALEQVRAPGVLIEGNSLLKFVGVDFAVMVARAGGGKIKPSARRALRVCSALYLSDDAGDAAATRGRFMPQFQDAADRDLLAALPLYTRAELPSLIARIRALHAPLMA